MNDLRDQLRDAFRQEVMEYQEVLRAALAAARAGSPPDGGRLDEVCRIAHSLKGAARAVEMPAVERLAHQLETLFERVRDGRDRLDGAAGELVGLVLDAVEDWTASLDGTRPAPDTDPLLARLAAHMADRAASSPEPLTEGHPEPAPEPVPAEAAPARPIAETVRVDAAQLDRILQAAGELAAEHHRQQQVQTMLRGLAGQLEDTRAFWARARTTMRAALPEGPAASALQPMLEAFEQRLRQTARLADAAWRAEDQAVRASRQLGKQLQEELRDARLVQAETILGGIRAMVRDIAAEQGVGVRAETSGLEVRADRLVLQRLRDPLLQLLRNAVGHGLEPPAERLSKGKPADGRVSVLFSVAGGLLTVTVEDDGRGIDAARVAATARRLGLLPPAGEPPSREELLPLIFAPGFTTRDEVTMLAGRGMGLSVVREAALRLGGHVTVDSPPEGGTTFRLVVPVAAMAQDLLMVEAAGQHYGIPVEGVERLHRVRTDAIGSAEGRPIITLADGVLPLAALADRIGLGGPEIRASRDIVPVVVLRAGGQRLALACEAFHGLRHVMVKDLGAPLPEGGAVAGGILLEDGTVALALNPFGLVNGAVRPGAVTVSETRAARRTPVILIADDSLTTRTLQKSILEAYDYEVRTAVDGVQALRRLRAERVDLVITDVQMPGMDGFELLAAIREDAALSSTPVVLVTSLDRTEDRAKGLALGADAYIVKREFSRDDLLATIGQLL